MCVHVEIQCSLLSYVQKTTGAHTGVLLKCFNIYNDNNIIFYFFLLRNLCLPMLHV